MRWTTSSWPSQVCQHQYLIIIYEQHANLHLLVMCAGKSSQLTSHSLPALFEHRTNMQRRQGHLAINAHRLSTRINSRFAAFKICKGLANTLCLRLALHIRNEILRLCGLNTPLKSMGGSFSNIAIILIFLQKICRVGEDPWHQGLQKMQCRWVQMTVFILKITLCALGDVSFTVFSAKPVHWQRVSVRRCSHWCDSSPVVRASGEVHAAQGEKWEINDIKIY